MTTRPTPSAQNARNEDSSREEVLVWAEGLQKLLR